MVIGLIVGGVLVGKDLIGAAAIRAQVTQIERFNTAAHTFQIKYNNYLPGDIPDPLASSLGFGARGTAEGEGDGNGVLEGIPGGITLRGVAQGGGETAMFWQDLSKANLIPYALTLANSTSNQDPQMPGPGATQPSIWLFFPQAAIGQGDSVLVFSSNGLNYFEIQNVVAVITCAITGSSYGLTPVQAYGIDSKIDDGNPATGIVQAQSIGTGVSASPAPYQPYNDLTGSASTCWDNNGNGSNVQLYNHYSVAENGGMNCALSIQMQ